MFYFKCDRQDREREKRKRNIKKKAEEERLEDIKLEKQNKEDEDKMKSLYRIDFPNSDSDIYTFFWPHFLTLSISFIFGKPVYIPLYYIIYFWLFKPIKNERENLISIAEKRIDISKKSYEKEIADEEKLIKNASQNNISVEEYKKRLKFEYKQLENFKYFLSNKGANSIFLTSFFQAVKENILPSGVVGIVDLENKDINETAIYRYLKLIDEKINNNWFNKATIINGLEQIVSSLYYSLYKKKKGNIMRNWLESKGIHIFDRDYSESEKYIDYFRSLYLWKEINLFSFTLFSQAVNKIEHQKITELKQVMFDNFIGDILNQYKLMNTPLNLLRFYSKHGLKRIKEIAKTYRTLRLNKQKFPHTIFLGNEEYSFYLIFALTELIPFVKINNIGIHKESRNIFKRFAIESQKLNLYSRLVFNPTNVLKSQNYVTKFVLIYIKFLEHFVGEKNSDVTINIIDVSGQKRDINDLKNYFTTVKSLDILPFKNEEDILILLSKNSIVDNALTDRAEFQVTSININFDEFVFFLRHEILEYISMNGPIISENEAIEFGLCIYYIAKKIYPRVYHLSIDEQRKILYNILDFLRSKVGKYTFKEILDVLG